MKKSIGILVALLGVFGCYGSEIMLGSLPQNVKDSTLKRYEIKSGSVQYESIIEGKVFGATVKGAGTGTLYFKDWGAVELVEEKESRTTVTKLFGKASSQEETIHNLSKLDHGKAFYVDFEKKEIRSQNDFAMESIQSVGNGDANQFGKEMFTSMGGEKIGEEDILGFKCEIWSLMGTKQWLYKGVVLKIEASIMGVKTTKIAVSAEFNKSIDEHYFELPNFKIVESK
ncbi:MAG: hypothetical protein N4A35_12420 [Flavobacteriales bacterium]|jgi:hypothetical protein|nr:hypothetical protein [Flavobacteriales bacterium]